MTAHKQVVRQDIKLSAKIVHNLDSRVGLWVDEKKEQEKSEEKETKITDQMAMDLEQAVSFCYTHFSGFFEYYI